MSPQDRLAHDQLAATVARRVRPSETANPWARYEALKRELPQTLTPAEYAAACRALAKRCGL